MTTQATHRTRQAVLYFMELQIMEVVNILKNEDADHSKMITRLQNLELALDNGTRRLGAAWFKGNHGYKISLSYKWAKACPMEVLFDTMRHELAHIVAGREAQHGIEWQKWAIKFSAEPNQYHTGEWQPPLKYKHICCRCGAHTGGSDRKWRVSKYHIGCGGDIAQVPNGEDMKKVKPITVVEESPAGDQAEPQPPTPVTPPRKTANESSRESKARQKAKNPELYNRIQSLASKVSRLKKDPSKHGELLLVKEELKQLRAEFAAL